jgi:uncharacterized transporter YbjL
MLLCFIPINIAASSLSGAIGSTEILLKSINTTRASGQKLSLSNKLGAGYSTNGDLLGVINPTKYMQLVDL